MNFINLLFIPITYEKPGSIKDFLLDKIDDYFYLGVKKAHVIKSSSSFDEVILSDSYSSLMGKSTKIISYFTIVIPLFMLAAKAALRFTHKFKVIEPEKLLEDGINIPEGVAFKIDKLMPKILQNQTCDEVKVLSSRSTLVLKLAEYPQLIFKLANPKYSEGKEHINSRFEKMLKAKRICILNELNLLVVPQAKKIILNSHDCIVEEALDFSSNESANEEDYNKHRNSLNETVRQVAVLAAKTGFNDVTWRNIPILKEKENSTSPRRVALIDLEHMQSSRQGFTGS